MQTISVIAAAAIASGCLAQSTFVNVFWEANDGTSGWTRNSLVTNRTSVQVRLAVEWNAPNSLAFGSLAFDAVINNAAAADAVTTISRIDPWQYIGENVAAFHQGNSIKIDNATDTSLPGAGSGWIITSQAAPDISTIGMDFSHSVFPFSFSLGFESSVYGTRHITMAPFHYHAGETSFIWMMDYSGLRVNATIQDVEVTYLPVPSTSVALSFAGLASIRRRRC